MVRLRDQWLMQDALEERLDWASEGAGRDADAGDAERLRASAARLGIEIGAEAARGGSALLVAQLVDRALPRRFRMDETIWLVRMARLQRHTKRELLRMCHRGWRRLGHPRPRGWRTPPFHRGVALATALRGMVREVQQRNDSAAGADVALADYHEIVVRELEAAGIECEG